MDNFETVSVMNEAFGNPQGDPTNIDYDRIRAQCINIGHEFVELLNALGADPYYTNMLLRITNDIGFSLTADLDAVRDALCDIHVFAYGAHHLMGIDANKDMATVVNAVMTRFVKDPQDQQETIDKHAAKGVREVYFEGTYPTMIMKSAVDQPDAPKGKFLKSASYKEPVFYTVK
jgi:hypothetical protein